MVSAGFLRYILFLFLPVIRTGWSWNCFWISITWAIYHIALQNVVSPVLKNIRMYSYDLLVPAKRFTDSVTEAFFQVIYLFFCQS